MLEKIRQWWSARRQTAPVRARIKRLGWKIESEEKYYPGPCTECQGPIRLVITGNRDAIRRRDYEMICCLGCGHVLAWRNLGSEEERKGDLFDFLDRREAELFAQKQQEHARLHPDEVTARLQRIRASEAQEAALLKQARTLREQRLREEALLPKESYRTEVKQLKE